MPKKPDLDPEYYQQHSSFQYDVAQALLQKTPFRGDERILDLGCGDGKISADLAAGVPRGNVIGVDPSPAMIAHASKCHRLPNLTFLPGYAEDPPVSGPFDLIVCFNAFHWVRDGARALGAMYQRLVPGGKVHILTYPGESPYADDLDKTLTLPRFAAYASQSASHTNMTTDAIIKAAQEIGFSINLCSREELVAHYENVQAFKDYVKGWLTSYAPIPEGEQDAFLDAACQQTEVPYLKLTLSMTRSI